MNKRFILLFFVTAFLVFQVAAQAETLDDAYQDYLYGDCQAAIEKAKRLREDDQTLYFLGLAHSKIGQYKKARSYFDKLLNYYPRSLLRAQTYVRKADTEFLEGNYYKAKLLYEQIKDDKKNENYLPLVYLRLAQIASKEGDWEQKRTYIRIIKDKYPKASEMEFVNLLSAMGEYFTIQVGAFNEKGNAFSLRQELIDRGYPAYVIEDKQKGFTLYKIRVGKYATRLAAGQALSSLREAGYPTRLYP